MKQKTLTRQNRLTGKLILLIFGSAASGMLSSGCYLLRQGSYLLTERARAVPVSALLESPELSENEREFFTLIASIRDFSGRRLGLPTGRNYTTYVRTDKEYLAAVVSGAGSLSLAPYLWKFPLIGEVPYKGFFSPENARKEASKLQERGWETWIRGVDAFSTLGFTRDPLYSFMLDYPVHRLAELIIHEQVHAAVWVRDFPAFNEELASFIGEAGARLFIEETFGPDSSEMRAMSESQHDLNLWLTDMAGLRGELQALYRSSLPEQEMLAEKERIIETFKDTFSRTWQERYLSDRYRRIPELQINNAFVALYSIYYGSGDQFQKFFVCCGSDIAEMLARLKPLNGSRENPYLFMEQACASAAGS